MQGELESITTCQGDWRGEHHADAAIADVDQVGVNAALISETEPAAGGHATERHQTARILPTLAIPPLPNALAARLVWLGAPILTGAAIGSLQRLHTSRSTPSPEQDGPPGTTVCAGVLQQRSDPCGAS
jgi:hypothetical protein